MKKLFIATGVVSALVMTGCASTTAPVADKGKAHHHPVEKHKHHKGEKKGERGHFQAFQCENDAAIKVHHVPEHDLIKTRINAPSWNLNDVSVDMKAAPAASGERFVNDVNASAKYEWHSKSNIGVLSVTDAKNVTTKLNCERVKFDKKLHKHKAPVAAS